MTDADKTRRVFVYTMFSSRNDYTKRWRDGVPVAASHKSQVDRNTCEVSRMHGLDIYSFVCMFFSTRRTASQRGLTNATMSRYARITSAAVVVCTAPLRKYRLNSSFSFLLYSRDTVSHCLYVIYCCANIVNCHSFGYV